MILDDVTTITSWSATSATGTRHVARRRRNRDLDAARGIILAAVIGAGVLAWAVVAMQLIWWAWR